MGQVRGNDDEARMTKPPKMPRKPDRLLEPGLTPQQVQCGAALAPFDERAIASERMWGVDRLIGLVSPETAARWASALGKLNAAVDAADISETVKYVGVCLRGFDAMDAEAMAAGHNPIAPDVWEIALDDGTIIGVYRDGRDWRAIQEMRPAVKLYSLREIVIGFLAKNEAFEKIEAVKAVFPGAEIKAITKMSMEDDIPF